MKKKEQGLILDWEAADSITVSNLVQIKETLETYLKKHQSGKWLHQEDVAVYYTTAAAIGIVLKYFGYEEESQ